MRSIVVLTATYNHPKELSNLYGSLIRQTYRDFTWLIVNDGSGQETMNALEQITDNTEIETIIINKDNGGKGSAINSGLDNLTQDVKFVLIVDDDEELHTKAIEITASYVCKYENTNCGAIHFNRTNKQGEVIANPQINADFVMSYQKFKTEGRHADGYIGYFVDKLGKNRFHIYDGEKYIAPSTLIMRITSTYDFLWSKEILGETEYLEGGITKQGRKLRIKNPRGMIEGNL